MAKRAGDDAPGMGARAGLSDGPALLFRMLQGFTNMFVRMVGHFLLLPARSLAAQGSPGAASDRQQEILFVDKRSIQSQVAKSFAEMGVQGTPIGAERSKRWLQLVA